LGDEMENIRILSTDKEMKIFSDPFRLQIISAYRKVTEPMTAKAIADILDVAPSKVHYHVKKLLEIDILELDHTQVINGILAKYYKLTADEFRLEVSDKSGDLDVIANQTIQVFHNVFEEYKSILYKTTNALLNDENAPRGKGTFLSSIDIYLDNEEAVAFHDEILALAEKYKEKKNDKQLCYKNIITAVQQMND